MSTSLRWRPNGDGASLDGNYSFPLKDALRGEFGSGVMIVSRESVDFLRGLRAGGIGGAQEILEILERHKVIEMWEVS